MYNTDHHAQGQRDCVRVPPSRRPRGATLRNNATVLDLSRISDRRKRPTPEGRGFLALFSAMAERERLRIVKRTQEGRRLAIEAGKAMGRKPKLTAHPHRWKHINAIVEPTWHDNKGPDRDQSERGLDDIVYDQREGISVAEAIARANGLPDRVTLYLYDRGDGTTPL
jgi:DNA invertase Pin-like site-specific DNA recombinase